MKLTTALLSIVFLAACSSESTSPSMTIPVPIVGPPAQITFNIVPGVGASATQAFIVATVTDARGSSVKGITVAFSTTTGTVNPTSVVTDAGGLAQTTLTAVTSATITATAGSVSATASAPIHADLSVSFSASSAVKNQATVFGMNAIGGTSPITYRIDFGDGFFDQGTSGQATHFYGQSATYPISVKATDAIGRIGTFTGTLTVVDPPAPPAPPPPPPPTPAPTLATVLTCTAATHPTPSTCNVTASYGGNPIPASDITKVDWDWGDGAKETTTPTTVPFGAPQQQHAYVLPGNFTIFATVTANTVDGPKTAAPATKVITVP